jgi:hypothetical protein
MPIATIAGEARQVGTRYEILPAPQTRESRTNKPYKTRCSGACDGTFLPGKGGGANSAYRRELSASGASSGGSTSR